MKFPQLEYTEMTSDVSKRPPAFLNRMQDFKDELEEIKVNMCHAYNITCNNSSMVW